MCYTCAMRQRNVLVMISPASGSRLAGVAHYAKEHGWYLMVQDRLGYQPPVWRGDGMLVTLRTDAATADLVKRVRRLIGRRLQLVSRRHRLPAYGIEGIA